jgi:hypothetical protein
MNSKRLARVTRLLSDGDAAKPPLPLIHELLADRDYWEAEAKRWRSRCPVTAEDVDRTGLTTPNAKAWLAAQDAPGPRWDLADPHILARLVNDTARQADRPAHDILTEMAAVEVEPPPRGEL